MTMAMRWNDGPRVMLALALACAATSAPLSAQVRTIDPNQAIDSDLHTSAPRTSSNQTSPYPAPAYPAAPTASQSYPPAPLPNAEPQRYPDAPGTTYPLQPTDGSAGAPAARTDTAPATGGAAQEVARSNAETDAATAQTFQKQELLRAAEGTFGKGTAGLAGILERTLKEQGYPNAYISGREAGGAVVVGLRYGKGEMFHKVEGRQPVYWTGPSVGFDLGGDANKVFVLVYNLYDAEMLYKRFPAVEGRVYFVGGFAATYLRRGNTVLIPIRLGVGWRQGVNLGYMKFSHTSKWFPF